MRYNDMPVNQLKKKKRNNEPIKIKLTKLSMEDQMSTMKKQAQQIIKSS